MPEEKNNKDTTKKQHWQNDKDKTEKDGDIKENIQKHIHVKTMILKKYSHLFLHNENQTMCPCVED